MNVMANIPLQPTVKKLRFLPSAELARYASDITLRSEFLAIRVAQHSCASANPDRQRERR
jgi:hypothetical protein